MPTQKPAKTRVSNRASRSRANIWKKNAKLDNAKPTIKKSFLPYLSDARPKMKEDKNKAEEYAATIRPISGSDIPKPLAKMDRYDQEDIIAAKVRNLIKFDFIA